MFRKRTRNASEDEAFYTGPVAPVASVAQAAPVTVAPVPVAPVPVPYPVPPVTAVPAPMPSISAPQVTLPQVSQHFIADTDRDDTYGQVQHWLKKALKPLLIIGAHGSGTTFMLQRCMTTELYDDQDIDDFLAPCGLRPRCPALIDDIESLDTKERQLVKNFVVNTKRRLVLTATDLFSEPAKAWSKFCVIVKLERPKKAFIAKVLGLHYNDTEVCEAIAESCNGSLAAGVQAVSMVVRGSQDSCSFSVPDAATDTMKTVGLLLGGTRVPCGGGTSDTSFVAQLVQINGPQAPCSIEALAKTIDRWSFFDVVDSRHILDAECQWTLMQVTALQGPKMPKDKFWRMEWPRSTKPKTKTDYEYHK